MMTTDEIQAKYLAIHDALGSRQDAEDKELFDLLHQATWNDCDAELRTRKAQLEAIETLTTEEQSELTDLQFMFPTPIEVEPIIFTPLNPTQGIEHRLTHVEEFLSQLYPPQP